MEMAAIRGLSQTFMLISSSLVSLCYRQDLPQAALPVLFLLTADFWVFRPVGATRCTDQGEICLLAKFHLDRSRDEGLRPPKLKKLEFYQYNWP